MHAPQFGQEGQINAEQVLEHKRACGGCRAALALRVVGKGEARYKNANVDGARVAAHQSAMADAQLLAGLAACPRCGTRESSAVRAVVGHVFVRLMLAAAVIAAAEWLEIGVAWIAAIPLAWVLFVSAVAVNIRRLVGARKRVTITVSEAGVPARIVATQVATRLEMQ